MSQLQRQDSSIKSSNSTLDFLIWLSERSPSEYMSLFSGSRQAAEKEAMTYQTICAMVFNYKDRGDLTSLVALHPEYRSLAQNSITFEWLVENKYFVRNGDRCAITQLAIARLYVHFANKLPVQPLLAG